MDIFISKESNLYMDWTTVYLSMWASLLKTIKPTTQGATLIILGGPQPSSQTKAHGQDHLPHTSSYQPPRYQQSSSMKAHLHHSKQKIQHANYKDCTDNLARKKSICILIITGLYTIQCCD